jgi:DNA-binding transcriptional ArsR family regulator
MTIKRKILDALKNGEATTSQIAEMTGLTAKQVSRRVTEMYDNHIVDRSDDPFCNNSTFKWSLKDGALDKILTNDDIELLKQLKTRAKLLSGLRFFGMEVGKKSRNVAKLLEKLEERVVKGL